MTAPQYAKRASIRALVLGTTLALAVVLASADGNQTMVGMAQWSAQCKDPAGQSDNCNTCANEDPNNNRCGGGGSWNDPWEQMSCSPFEYRPMSYNNAKPADPWCGNYDNFYEQTLFYDDTGRSQGKWNPQPNVGVRAWAGDFSAKKTGKCANSDYWVFHACDGAGIQGADCKGDVKYIEHFGTKSKDQTVLPTGNGCHLATTANNEERWYCNFVHPGTHTVYDDYRGGWLGFQNQGGDYFWAKHGHSDASIDFGLGGGSHATGPWDQQSRLVHTLQDLPNWYYGYTGGKHPVEYAKLAEGGYFSFMLYPWRLGDNGNAVNNNNLSWPSYPNYGKKMFVDNERCGDNGVCNYYPPKVELIIGGLTWQDVQGNGNNGPKIVFDLWESDKDGNLNKINQNGWFVLYPVHHDDGSCAPW
mmetsp:Transcript_15894/g.40521  ORF Transcript_15894/g.40521 Transcript_15894/m.40521 type:complete len:416 (+) Transcript_15894:219-1466(+)